MQPYEFLSVAADLVNKSPIPPTQTIYLTLINGELQVLSDESAIPPHELIFKLYPRHRTEGLTAREWHSIFSKMIEAYMEGRLH